MTSVICLCRALPLLLGPAPRTPLRILCIVALDTIHTIRYLRPLPRARRHELAVFLDFQACTNAMWDGKPMDTADYQALRQRLEAAGLSSWIADYLSRLRGLEANRPAIGGGRRRFDEVRSYREGVVRVSLAAVAAVALNAECVEGGIRATHGDSDVAALFQMAMQCQIIDDVLDYRQDLAAGLPSFLTACSALPQAMSLTAEASRSYGTSRDCSAGMAVFPLRVALWVITAAAHAFIVAGRGLIS